MYIKTNDTYFKKYIYYYISWIIILWLYTGQYIIGWLYKKEKK